MAREERPPPSYTLRLTPRSPEKPQGDSCMENPPPADDTPSEPEPGWPGEGDPGTHSHSSPVISGRPGSVSPAAAEHEEQDKPQEDHRPSTSVKERAEEVLTRVERARSQRAEHLASVMAALDAYASGNNPEEQPREAPPAPEPRAPESAAAASKEEGSRNDATTTSWSSHEAPRDPPLGHGRKHGPGPAYFRRVASDAKKRRNERCKRATERLKELRDANEARRRKRAPPPSSRPRRDQDDQAQEAQGQEEVGVQEAHSGDERPQNVSGDASQDNGSAHRSFPIGESERASSESQNEVGRRGDGVQAEAKPARVSAHSGGAPSLDAVHSALDAIPVLLSASLREQSMEQGLARPPRPTRGSTAREHPSFVGAQNRMLSIENGLKEAGEEEDEDADEQRQEMATTCKEADATPVARLRAVRSMAQTKAHQLCREAERAVGEWRRLRSRGQMGGGDAFEEEMVRGLSWRQGQQAALKGWALLPRLRRHRERLVEASLWQVYKESARGVLHAWYRMATGESSLAARERDAAHGYNLVVSEAAWAHWRVFCARNEFERAAEAASVKLRQGQTFRAWRRISHETAVMLARAAGSRPLAATHASGEVDNEEEEEGGLEWWWGLSACGNERTVMRSAAVSEKREEHKLRFHNVGESANKLRGALREMQGVHTQSYGPWECDEVLNALARADSRLRNLGAGAVTEGLAGVCERLSKLKERPAEARQGRDFEEAVQEALTAAERGETSICTGDNGAAERELARAVEAEVRAFRRVGPSEGVREAIARAERASADVADIDRRLAELRRRGVSGNSEEAALLRMRRGAYDRLRDAVNAAERLKGGAHLYEPGSYDEGHPLVREKPLSDSVKGSDDEGGSGGRVGGVLADRPREKDGIARLHFSRWLAKCAARVWLEVTTTMQDRRQRAEHMSMWQPALRGFRGWHSLVRRKAANAEAHARGVRLRRARVEWLRRARVLRDRREREERLLGDLKSWRRSLALRGLRQCLHRNTWFVQRLSRASHGLCRARLRSMTRGWRSTAQEMREDRQLVECGADELAKLKRNQAFVRMLWRARKRILVRRVLLQALSFWRERWEEEGHIPFSAEYRLLLNCLATWREDAKERQRQRWEEAAVSTADGWRQRCLEAKALGAFEREVDEAEEETAEPLRAACLLRLWRVETYQPARVKVRRQLRKHGLRRPDDQRGKALLKTSFVNLREEAEAGRQRARKARAYLLGRVGGPFFRAWRGFLGGPGSSAWAEGQVQRGMVGRFFSAIAAEAQAGSLRRGMLEAKAWRAWDRARSLAAKRRWRGRAKVHLGLGPRDSHLALLARRKLLRRKAMAAWRQLAPPGGRRERRSEPPPWCDSHMPFAAPRGRRMGL